MDLPIKFPSDAEVILEEVTRFRALSPENRVRSIGGLLTAGADDAPVAQGSVPARL